MDVSKCPVHQQWQDAFNQGKASAVAALYTPDAIEVTPVDIRVGPAAVKERIEAALKEGSKNAVITATKCDIEGDVRWSSGPWKDETAHGPLSGFWTIIEVKNGDSWKIRNVTYSLTPPQQK
jgi:ketosteroid isomerase-like protein